MGTLFPNDDEYPDYRRIPMSWPSGKVVTVAFGLLVSANGLRPSINPDEDPPHREYHEIRARAALSAMGSTSENMLWPGNSDEAANVVLRRHHGVRLDAVRAITASSTFSSPDDL